MSNRQFYTRFGAVIFLSLLGMSFIHQPAISQEPLLVPPLDGPQPNGVQPAGHNEQVEVLTHGPVHEAFAESIQLDPKSDLLVKKQPPAAIEEVPPDVKPAGDNVAWIPGYWSWDDTRNDFLWVSGVFRATPPNRTWVPGYFAQANDGWKWTPGFWAQAQAQHVEYLPQPPATLESGPTSDSPGNDHYWVSGCWLHRGGHYAWRPGYWTAVNPNWIWIPDHYAWAPCGYVFVPGYWDYPMNYRGTLFAPVCFHEPVYLNRVYVYRPAVVVDVGILSVHLWNRPQCSHYYFGDYYGATYVGLGYSPWFVSYSSYHGCYDPMFNYYRCVHHDEPRWAVSIQIQHNYYVEHENHRPPATFAAQADFSRRMHDDPHPAPAVVAIGGGRVGTKVGSTMMATTLSDAVDKKNVTSPTNFERIKPETHQQLTSSLKEVRAASAERSQHETAAATGGVKIGQFNPNNGGATGATNPTNATGQNFALQGKPIGGVKLNSNGTGVTAMSTQQIPAGATNGSTAAGSGVSTSPGTNGSNGNPLVGNATGQQNGRRTLGGPNGTNNASGAAGTVTGSPPTIGNATSGVGNNLGATTGLSKTPNLAPPNVSNPVGGNPIVSNPSGGNPGLGNAPTGVTNNNPPNLGAAKVLSNGGPTIGNPPTVTNNNPPNGSGARILSGGTNGGNPALGNPGVGITGGNKPPTLNPTLPTVGPGVGVAPRAVTPQPRNPPGGGNNSNSNKGKNDDKGKGAFNLQPDARRIVVQPVAPSFSPPRERVISSPTIPKAVLASPSVGNPNAGRVVAKQNATPSQPNPAVTSRLTFPNGQARGNSQTKPVTNNPNPDDAKKIRDKLLGR